MKPGWPDPPPSMAAMDRAYVEEEIREAKAEAWSEGYAAGGCIEHDEYPVNPYRDKPKRAKKQGRRASQPSKGSE